MSRKPPARLQKGKLMAVIGDQVFAVDKIYFFIDLSLIIIIL